MSIAKFSVRNPVLVNMFMIAAIVLGSYSMVQLPRELTPDVSFPWVFIFVPNPGVAPDENEKLIANPIEDELSDIDGLVNILSYSRQGGTFVWLKFETMSDDEFDKRYQTVRNKLARVSLPETALDPEVSQFKTQDFQPMVNVVLSGRIPERELKDLAEDLRRDIMDLPDIAQVQITGVREREIWVEVDPKKLEAFGLSIRQIMDAIRANNLNLTGGEISIGRWDYTIRTIGELQRLEQIESIIVRPSPNGEHIRIRDVARVRESWAERETITRYNGNPSVTLTVAKKARGNSIQLIDAIKAIADEYRRNRLPEAAEIHITQDTSIYIKEILGTLQSNALLGMVLVLISLYFLLGWRNAILAALGIPVTFMLTFLFMKFSNYSISGSSLFAMVLVLGMIVDDAIVIIENCFRYYQRGFSATQAAILGTQEVAIPVIASSATTVAAFLPLVLLPGVIGEFMKIIPIVVSMALAASLFESLVILPSHFAEFVGWGRGGNKPLISFRNIRMRYVRWLKMVLRHRYRVVGVAFLLLLLSVPLAFIIGVDMFASEEIPQFFIYIDAAEGTTIEATDEIVRQVEALALALPKEEVRGVVANTGIKQTQGDWEFKPNVGQVIVDLVRKKYRERSAQEIMNDLREKIARIPGIVRLQFWQVEAGPPTGSPVEVKVKGPHLEELRQVAEEVKAVLRQMDGVYDVRDDFIEGRKELHIRINPARASMFGLQVAQVAMAVRNAYAGGVAGQILDGDKEIDIVVKLQNAESQTRSDLEHLRIQTPTGAYVYLKDIAVIQDTIGYTIIHHDDGERAITISANIDREKTTTVKVNGALKKAFEDIARRYPDYHLKFGGQFEEFKDAFKNLGMLFLLGVVLMYVILAGQFRSYIQPLIIFTTIIFAFWGATIGLFVIDSPFSINNLFGLVALAGVAVNDSLVMMSFINNARERGVSRWRSILLAGKLRLRPILLTSITTILGLLPMAIGLGGYSEVWGPLANVIAWGLAVATLLTLFLVPCLYAIVGDVKKRVLGRRFMDETGHIISREKDQQRRDEIRMINGGRRL